MNNINVLNFSTSDEKFKASGLAPVIGYEPWSLRTIESVKQSIAEGIPVLIRLHSAADYPCVNYEQGYKLDRESHAVMIVGYDDEEEMFDIVDPWQKAWGGEYGGLERLPYDEIFNVWTVNCSLDKATRLSPPTKEVEKIVDENGNTSVKLMIGYYIPKGYIIDEKQNAFTSFDIIVKYEYEGLKKKYEHHLKGRWNVGELAEIITPIGKNISGNVNIDFHITATIEGERPYHYKDKIEFPFTENMYFEEIMFNKQGIQKNLHVNKKSFAFTFN